MFPVCRGPVQKNPKSSYDLLSSFSVSTNWRLKNKTKNFKGHFLLFMESKSTQLNQGPPTGVEESQQFSWSVSSLVIYIVIYILSMKRLFWGKNLKTQTKKPLGSEMKTTSSLSWISHWLVRSVCPGCGD